MKVNLEVEIDFIDEEYRLDDQIKHAVIDKIAGLANRDLTHSIKKHALRKIDERVDDWINEQLEKFCDRRIEITDKWGDTQEHHESVTEMFKAKFDEFFNASVDEKGKTEKSCSYGTRTTRVEHMLDKKAKEYLKKITDGMERNISNAIDKHQRQQMEEKITKLVIEKVAKVMEKEN